MTLKQYLSKNICIISTTSKLKNIQEILYTTIMALKLNIFKLNTTEIQYTCLDF